jgi:hypothetical protein
MPNGEFKPINIITKKQHAEVIILKMVVLAVILILPLAFIFFDFCKVRLAYNSNYKGMQIPKTNNAQIGNFEAPLPIANAADLSQVSQEKIDTLFSNLK